jgi:hypothetical protein
MIEGYLIIAKEFKIYIWYIAIWIIDIEWRSISQNYALGIVME